MEDDSTPKTAMVPASFAELRDMAKVLSGSSLLPAPLRDREADVTFAIKYGEEIGMPPITALRNIHIIEGRPSLSADALVAMVLRSGLAEYFEPREVSEHGATWATKRVGRPEVVRRFTLKQARDKGLYPGKDRSNWRRWPERMMSARAKASLARDVYPEVCAGIHEPGEVADEYSVEPARTVRDARDVTPGAAFTPAPASGEQTVSHGDVEIVDGELVDEESVDGESVDGELVDGELVDGGSVDGESVDGESVDNGVEASDGGEEWSPDDPPRIDDVLEPYEYAVVWLKEAPHTEVARFTADEIADALRRDLPAIQGERRQVSRWCGAVEKHASRSVLDLLRDDIAALLRGVK